MPKTFAVVVGLRARHVLGGLTGPTRSRMSLSSLLTRSQRASYWAVIRREREMILAKNAVALLLEGVKVTDGQCSPGQCSICLDEMDESLEVVKLSCGHGQCSICLDEMDESLEVVELSCGHHFHKRCVTQWLLTKNITCPLCKKQLAVSKPKACDL